MKQSTEPAGEHTGYVYMLECRDGSLYTGWTTDITRRLRVHNSGQGARYTRSRLLEEAGERSPALRREAAIKKLSRIQKEKLVASGRNLLHSPEIRQEV